MNDPTISSKVAYVKSQGQTRRHHCHWLGCEANVPPAMWGCTRHWYALPKHLRALIWRTYRPGQEMNLTPSRAYLDAAELVQKWIRENAAPVKVKKSDAVPGQQSLFGDA